MPKITEHGGASNRFDGSGDPAQASVSGSEPTRGQDPNAPIARPGEGAFFAGRDTPTVDDAGEDVADDEPSRPAKRAGKRAASGARGPVGGEPASTGRDRKPEGERLS